MSKEKNHQDRRPEARLYDFLQEIYGDQVATTGVEVDVEALSGGAYGAPHLEATEVRVYAYDAQLLPDFEGVPYWQEMLTAYPNLFQDCTTHQDRLDTVQEILERERLYLEYGLEWPSVNEKVISPLRFTIEELRQIASADSPRKDELSIADQDQERKEDATSSLSYTPYDAGYPRVQKKQLDLQAYVIQKERLEQDGYLLSLGAFVQFALEAFPALYPQYRVPDSVDKQGKHLLELFLYACYGKHFTVLATTFWVEDEPMQRAMPNWAIRWMQLWRKLPPGTPIGKEEVLSLLDWLWNTPMDARGVLTTAMDNWFYKMIYGEREHP